jgi:dTDP-4-dehydrorhamnose reductase
MSQGRTILVLGSTGQVGGELTRALASLGRVVAPSRADADLSSPASLREILRGLRPALVVNAAAYTAVDEAESEPGLAYRINAEAPAILCEEARSVGAALVHYSTDYVFDGTKTDAYVESDAPAPLNVYGASKLAGEQAVTSGGVPYLVLRLSWVYAARGHNFLLTMLRLAGQRKPLRIVNDQFGAPTPAPDVARATADILARCLESGDASFADAIQPVTGTYHLSCAGRTMWYEFARTIFADCELTVDATPVSTAEYPAPAKRPRNSMLSNEKLHRTFGVLLPDWQAGLRSVLAQLNAPGASIGHAPGEKATAR